MSSCMNVESKKVKINIYPRYLWGYDVLPTATTTIFGVVFHLPSHKLSI
jgi:hypothetical protein